MKQQNKSAFSLVIALGLTIVMSLLVLYILEYIIPYAKNVKGIENSTSAFYQAESSIEEGLYFFKNRSSLVTEKTQNYSGVSPVNYKYQTESKGQVIPILGEGNSEYDDDKNYNTISSGDPIQLEVGLGSGINWDTTKIFFRLPDLDEDSSHTDQKLKEFPVPLNAYIDWQLSSSTNTLFSKIDFVLNNNPNMIKKEGICMQGSTTACSNGILLNSLQGQDLSNPPQTPTFKQFYASNCSSASGSCILKISVINRLQLDDGNSTPVPYLEYKIAFNSSNSVPLRYSRIKSTGKSYGFQKELEVRVPQQTVNEGFNFTVFQ